MSDALDRVRAIVFRAVSDAMGKPVEELSDETRLVADLGAKSVNFVRIISELEDQLDLEIPYMEFRRSDSIADAIEYIARLLES